MTTDFPTAPLAPGHEGAGGGAVEKSFSASHTKILTLPLGASEHVAKRVAGNSRCWWRNSAGELNRVLTIAYFDKLGVPRLS